MQPLPNPDEDDGRPIPALVLQQVACVIAEEYTPQQILVFLDEAGIPLDRVPFPRRRLTSAAIPVDSPAAFSSGWTNGFRGRRRGRGSGRRGRSAGASETMTRMGRPTAQPAFFRPPPGREARRRKRPPRKVSVFAAALAARTAIRLA
jgi:hypothetical protein